MSSNYNSRYRPAEVLWMNGKGHLIRAHETFEDLLKNQIPLPVEAETDKKSHLNIKEMGFFLDYSKTAVLYFIPESVGVKQKLILLFIV
jgi:hypothetical protein